MCVQVYLLLILPLQMKPGLNVSSGLLEGLSLGNLGRVVGTDANDVGAQEDQDISTHLERVNGGGVRDYKALEKKKEEE